LSTEQERKNPKKIFIDFAKNVQESANKTKKTLEDKYITDKNIDVAKDYLSDIIGQCKTMLVILENTD
jgi:hypothetical protein